MNLIVAGTIGRSGLGGQAWAVLQYLLGLRALGHEVIYLEDCGESSWVYDRDKQEWTTELDYPADYVRACQRCLPRLGSLGRTALNSAVRKAPEMSETICAAPTPSCAQCALS